MSFDIYIYEKSARMVKDFDAENPPRIRSNILDEFKERLLRYDYQMARQGCSHVEYTHKDARLAILVSVFDTEICFSVAYSTNAQDAIFEALMTASELCDHGELVLYDPQNGGWAEA